MAQQISGVFMWSKISLAAGLIICLSCIAAALGYRRQAIHYRNQLAETSKRTEPGVQKSPAQHTPLFTLPPAEPGPKREKNDAETLVLKNRIRELETTLTNRPSPFDRRSPRGPSTNRTEDAASRPRRGPQAWLDNLKETDPNHYEEFVSRREESRLKVQTAFSEKASHLLSRDLETMADEERATYTLMAQLLNDTWQKTEQLRTDLPWDQRHEVMRSVRTNMVMLEPLLLQERDKEWVNFGRELGYDDPGAVELANYLNRIIELTSMQDVYREMRSGTFGNMPGRRNAITSSVPVSVTR
jgi:hypothetical protein